MTYLRTFSSRCDSNSTLPLGLKMDYRYFGCIDRSYWCSVSLQATPLIQSHLVLDLLGQDVNFSKAEGKLILL